MKLKKISLAVASALAVGAAGQASAITLNNYTGATVNVFTAGATAQDGLIRAYMRLVCSNTVDEFQASITQPAATIGGNIYANTNPVLQSAYFCTISGTKIPALGGKTLLLRKSSGDSGEGVYVLHNVTGSTPAINYFGTPTAVATTVNPTGASNFTCATSASTAAGGGLQAIQQWSCTAFPTVSTATVGGFADVEPGLLNSLLVPQLSSELGHLKTYNTASQLWGIATTKNLRNALQKVQGWTVGSDNEDQMPSLSQTLVSGILSGNIGTWDLLTDKNNAFDSITSTAGVTAPSSLDVFLVRRPDSSGTMASIRSIFLNFPCGPGTQDIPTDNTGGTCGADPGGLSVNVQQGTSGLLGCLKTLHGAGKWGIGFASTSNRPAATLGDVGGANDANWRWIKVDGVSPTLLNGATGRYKLQTEGTLSYRNDGVGPTGDAKTFIDTVGAGLGTTDVLGPVNTGGAGNQAYAAIPWQAGALVPASATSPTPDYANINTKPQSALTRSFNSANSCQPEIVFGTPTPIN